jgi:catechol 2,3-dioxygenase-like lactoylglutathione lyase family enzyme
MRIRLVSIQVDDQEKALRFYTDVLGFQKKQDIPAGAYRWISVVSPEDPDGAELVLEPNANPVGKAYQEGLYGQRIPATAFEVADVDAEYQRLGARGVTFQSAPLSAGPVKIAVLDDGCGNWIQLYQHHAA